MRLRGHPDQPIISDLYGVWHAAIYVRVYFSLCLSSFLSVVLSVEDSKLLLNTLYFTQCLVSHSLAVLYLNQERLCCCLSQNITAVK